MEITELAIVPIVVGITEVAKRIGLDSRWAPLLAIIIGIGLTYLIVGVNGIDTVRGIIYGLAASGLYSGTKATIKSE